MRTITKMTLVLGGIMLLAVALSDDPTRPRPTVSPPPPRLDLSQGVAIEWQQARLDTDTALHTIELRFFNNNDLLVKDLTVRCRYQGGSGTVIAYITRTVFEIVPPKKARTFTVNFGFWPSQAKQVGCELVSVGRL